MLPLALLLTMMFPLVESNVTTSRELWVETNITTSREPWVDSSVTTSREPGLESNVNVSSEQRCKYVVRDENIRDLNGIFG